MRLLGAISEDEMIDVYLRAELESDRFGPQLRDLLARDGRELASTDAAYRRRLLDEHRGYPSRTGMFDGFPLDVEWHRASLTRDEVLDVLYIDYSWWVELSGGTRRPRDAARRIRAGDLTGMTAGATAEEHEPFLASTSELIAVTTVAYEKLVVIEGHARLTAYALFPERVPDDLELILGVSADVERWWAFQPCPGSDPGHSRDERIRADGRCDPEREAWVRRDVRAVSGVSPRAWPKRAVNVAMQDPTPRRPEVRALPVPRQGNGSHADANDRHATTCITATRASRKVRSTFRDQRMPKRGRRLAPLERLRREPR